VYSSTLVFLALMLYHYALSCHHGWRRRLLFAVFGLVIFSVYLSFSRSSWVGMAAVVGGLLLIYPKTTSRLLLVLILLAVLVGGSLMADELSWTLERLTGRVSERSVEGRVIVNYAMMEMAADRPLLGWGYNRYRYYLSQYKAPVGDISVHGHRITTSHNSYLTIATELGVPALLVYLFPAGWWLIKSMRARKALPSEGLWSSRLVVVLWLAMLHMFIENNAVDMMSHNPFGTTLWWMALGLIATVVSPHRREEEASPEKPFGV
jgi:O-antigen ligase